jgi:hypothetical protein
VVGGGLEGQSGRAVAWFYKRGQEPDKVWIQVGNRKMGAAVESLTGADREQASSQDPLAHAH